MVVLSVLYGKVNCMPDSDYGFRPGEYYFEQLTFRARPSPSSSKWYLPFKNFNFGYSESFSLVFRQIFIFNISFLSFISTEVWFTFALAISVWDFGLKALNFTHTPLRFDFYQVKKVQWAPKNDSKRTQKGHKFTSFEISIIPVDP